MPIRFHPRPIPTLAALALIVLTVSLGRWQSGRAEEKLALQAILAARAGLPAHVVQAADRDGDALRYRKVTAGGEYVAEKQIYLDNKDHAGAVGFHVLTPLALSGSTVKVMVNRGWIARGRDYPRPPVAEPPVGQIEVNGMAVLPVKRFLELSGTTVQGSVWQNFTFERGRDWLGIDLLPVIILAAPASPGLVPVTETPDAGADKHRGYAVQWFAMAVAVFILWIVVNLKRS